MHQEHFEQLLNLIEMERQAERAENERKLEKYPVQEREAMGKTVTRLVLQREDVGVGGHPLWILSRPSSGEDISPFQAFNQGDVVMVSYAGEESGTRKIRGTLYDVDQYEITVALDTRPEEPPKGKCQIDELGSEATYKRMKKALEQVMRAEKKPVAHLREIFMGELKPVVGSWPELRFFNERLNNFQKEAVQRALASQEVALVHGPPGTGKTTVLIEIIRQAVEEGLQVLATAPSNIAVDNILEKLLATEDLRVVRMGHPARTLESLRHATLSAQLLEHDGQAAIRELDQRRELLIRQRARRQDHNRTRTWDETKGLEREIEVLWKEARNLEYSLSRQILSGAHVVLATHGGISKPILSSPFDIIIMDEASQATEPLSWIPITQAKKVVFAGDPLQLPPTIYSEKARTLGLDVTLFERLQKILPPEAQTLLRIQYRMHETIMGFSSREFYDGALVADESVRTHTAAELEGVETNVLTQNPLVYVDTAGTGFDEQWNDLLESRQNEGEAKLAVQLCRQLLDSGVPSRSIAILTPYVAQARLLRSILKDRSVEIDSVDGFQGREKEVTIISLVRSNEQGEIGFLDDTRRMNVAMTRARRLLIVVGDSATISRHPFYDQFLQYVDQHDAHHSAWEWLQA